MIDSFNNLTTIQQNILIASIIADGEITKRYTNSRRKNHSYREHYGKGQVEYRKWKQSFFPELLYLTPKSQTLRSRSLPLFTELYPYFYDEKGNKKIPIQLLHYCKDLYFLSIIYMDDGTLSISKHINHNKKVIYLTPHVYLYLQNFHLHELEILQKHIMNQFSIKFAIAKRSDGHGNILRFTRVQSTFNFLNDISACTQSCKSMFYKTNWNFRLKLEREKYNKLFPNYTIKVSSSERNKNYTEEEIKAIINFKKRGRTDKYIATAINRSYWSVVYKISELRKGGLL